MSGLALHSDIGVRIQEPKYYNMMRSSGKKSLIKVRQPRKFARLAEHVEESGEVAIAQNIAVYISIVDHGRLHMHDMTDRAGLFADPKVFYTLDIL